MSIAISFKRTRQRDYPRRQNRSRSWFGRIEQISTNSVYLIRGPTQIADRVLPGPDLHQPPLHNDPTQPCHSRSSPHACSRRVLQILAQTVAPLRQFQPVQDYPGSRSWKLLSPLTSLPRVQTEKKISTMRLTKHSSKNNWWACRPRRRFIPLGAST